MSSSTKNLDPAFQGAGQKIGTEIWRIENFEPVPLQKADYGKFYSGDSYIVLHTSPGKGGAYVYDIHYWIGKDTSQDEAGTAAIKTVDLDAVLGGRAVQHRELQGHESDKFLSYFKPCIIPLEGGVASGFRKPEEEKFEIRLYVCRGKRAVKLKQVPFARSSLNHDDVFILDTENKIYQFNGANSNIQERAKSLEVIQYLKDKYHEGKCDVAIVDDGKLQADSDSGEFWVLFGGFAPIGKKVASEDDVSAETTSGKLYRIDDDQLTLEENILTKALLENNKCYLLDCGAEIYVWVGRVTQIEERKTASKIAEEFIISQNRPRATRIIQVIQGFEPYSFKSKFESWPASTGTGNSSGEDGRGKVAAMLKQQGVDLKGTSKSTPIDEEVPPLLHGGGKLEVWRINGSAKTPIAKEDMGKFYGGDCYIVLYTYHSGEKKEEYFLCCWMGNDSIQDDQNMAMRLANTMCSSLKGRPALGRIFQGKESPQFIALFQPMVVLKGGLSTGYKKLLADKGLNDETYATDGIALIQISGISPHNNKALQVEAVAASLCSTDCFLLQSGNSVFIWQGTSSISEQQEWAAKVAELLKPGCTLKHAKEGTESSAFWFALGGKQNYTSKKVAQETTRDPHLYSFEFNKGKFEVSEIYNFSQDDLLAEDVLILDTLAEVFVWVGQCVDPKEKQKAFEIGQKYIDLAVRLEGLSPEVPLYRVTEGNEPCFFTTYFDWDSTKATVHGNSFEKKLYQLLGAALHSSEKDRISGSNHNGPTQRASALAALSSAFNSSSSLAQSSDRPNITSHDGPTQRASALAALSSAFSPSSDPKKPAPKPVRSSQGSQRAAAVAALSSVLTAEKQKGSSEPSTARSSRSTSPDPAAPEGEDIERSTSAAGNGHPSEISGAEEESSTNINDSDSIVKKDGETDKKAEGTFSYEQVKAKSSNPVSGIDTKRREVYLSDAEFEKVLGMTKEAFYRQPKWKQDLLKRKVDLF